MHSSRGNSARYPNSTRAKPRAKAIYSEPSVEEECCHVMKSLAASLLRAEQALSKADKLQTFCSIAIGRIRSKRAFLIVPYNNNTTRGLPYLYRMAERSCDYIRVNTGWKVEMGQQGQLLDPLLLRENALRRQVAASSSPYERDYIGDATVMRGTDTKEWGGRVALWGILPLWRASPPPSTVLALRKPVPSDCWPFSGSRGEMIIRLEQPTKVRCISIEHVRPDTAKSAPKDFILYFKNRARSDVTAEWRDSARSDLPSERARQCGEGHSA
ncbi:hypothetical protein MSG28_004060 [Choristoneura fumiferana]|uniref:Uncharacterized protein n=1 Tax=Choristoneura fumiferana TaxID=7141 RepID=A0ACC0KH85_CHOFU|nr:hypothetical protein MSG28_004060 [Choristoneura fumiferana]